MKAPIYRGTRKELEAESENALAWFKSMITKAAAEIGGEHEKRIVNVLDNLVYQNITYKGDHFFGSKDRTDYHYVWECGLKEYCGWSKQRFVLRKNGTIHTENLKEALLNWAVTEKQHEYKQSILTYNKTLLAKIEKPDVVHLTLSENEKGVVKFSVYGFPETKCMIENLPGTVKKAEALAAEYKALSQ